jgi:hypothetical protein
MEAGSKKLEAGKPASLQGTKPCPASSLEPPVSWPASKTTNQLQASRVLVDESRRQHLRIEFHE